MRVLVTGGCGYVGSHAARDLTASGHQVVLYDNLSTGHRKFSEGYEFIEADIADEVQLAMALEGAEAVMHFAASAYVGESVTNPRKYFRNNVESALKLLDAVLASSARLFIFSLNLCHLRNSAIPADYRIEPSGAYQSLWGDKALFRACAGSLFRLAWVAVSVAALLQCRRRSCQWIHRRVA